MGFAGGLVPSPSAVVVLLGAVAIGQAWFGVVLVLAYGVGLASTLVLVGLLVVGSGRFLADRFAAGGAGPGGGGGRRVVGRVRASLVAGRLRALAPPGAAAAVVVVGLGLVLRSLSVVVV